ncbi:MAG: response regulator transcription factor [Bacillota bacterium]
MQIMIADDHPLFAEGLRNLLETENFEIAAVVNDGEKAVKTALEKKPDLIMMDIKMPKLNGIEATYKIKNKLPDTVILILTSFEEDDSLFKAIRAGASGYLLKSLNGEELIKSLHELENGKNPFSPGLEECLFNKFRNYNEAPPIDIELSERQMEIINLVSDGYTYKEVAEELFLSEATIKYHMNQIKEKLSMKNRAQVISYAKRYLL